MRVVSRLRLKTRLRSVYLKARTALPRVSILYAHALAAMPPWKEETAAPQGVIRGLDALDRMLRGLRRPFAAVLAFSLPMNLLTLTLPIYMSQVYDRVLTAYSAPTLILLTLMALGLLLLFAAIDHARNQVLAIATLKAEQDLGGPLLAASLKDQLAGRPDATLPLRDLVALRSFATSSVLAGYFDAPMIPLYALIMFMIHWAVGLVTVLGALVMIALARVNQHVTHTSIESAGRATNALLHSADLHSRNAEIIEAMGLLPQLEARWRMQQDRVLEEQLSVQRRGAPFQFVTRYLRLSLQILALALGAGLVLDGDVTPGMMFATSIILARALQPIEIVVGSWRNLLAAKDSYERIGKALARIDPETSPMTLPSPEGRLALEHIQLLAPRGGKAILRGLSFTLERGETLGIIGPAAAGKSTLGRVILGVLPPTSGIVRLDGYDIAKWPRAALGRDLGYLPQDVELFPATVAENIARMGEIEPAAVIAAARMAGVHDMVQRLPDGYDTRIMEGGIQLSHGQRQQLGLARCLYGAPRLVVLDEPNANLDGEGEEALERALQDLKARLATVIVITHRRGILRNVDRVALLREGVLQAYGPRDDVLALLSGHLSGRTSGSQTVVPLRPPIPPGSVVP